MMARQVMQGLATIAVLALAAGCGGTSAPTGTESSAATAASENAPESSAAASDPTPVLPIPDDVPVDAEQPAAATIKPIPDDE